MQIITKLAENEIFVFGSNLAGRHGAGAAKMAIEFGAKFGQGEGLAGKTYAIPTKDLSIKTMPLDSIAKSILRFIVYAAQNPDMKFLVTPIGCGLAGYTPKDIAPLFLEHDLTPNIILPEEFLP